MNKRTISWALLASLSMLAACGGSSGDASSAAAAATATATSTSTDEAVAYALAATTATATSRGGYTSAPVITVQPTSVSVTAASSVSFSVVAYGAATLSYQWRKDGTAISGATAATYAIASAGTSDAGNYDVVITNSKGSATSSAAALTLTSASTGAFSAAATTAAQAFAATLSSTQQSAVQLAWNLDTARRWSNLPASFVARNGISWGALSTDQKTAARALIATALSASGNTLHMGLQAADDYLAANGGGSSYGNGQFYIAFLGTPSATGFWMLQLTGHHLTYNISFNGSYKTPTPLFLGVEPKAAFTQSGSTYDPMAEQRTAFGNLGTALVTYSGAKLTGTYSDLLFGANGSGGIDNTCPRAYAGVTEHGLLYANLSAADKALVQAAVKTYVNTQASTYADDLLAAYFSDTALASTYVAYAGSGTVTTNGSYFRVEGPRLWLEFSVQRGVIFGNDIHFHTIWRDKTGDYGGKCLS